MWPYWLMFLLPAAAALSQPTRPWAQRPPVRVLDIGASWVAVTLLWAVIVGLRSNVGGDWGNYVQHSLQAQELPLSVILARGEPGYWLVMWATAGSPGAVYLANLVFGLLFSLGLIVFCRAQPRPWLALAVAVPYLVIVLGMGYTRQGVALGLSMIGLVALARRRTVTFVLCVAAGALFHKTAIVLIPLGMLAVPHRRIWTAAWVGVTAFALYRALLSESVDALQLNYIDAEYQSEGALVRVMMNVLPALLLLFYRRRFTWTPAERNLWIMIALLALASALALAVSPSSTAVDRVALYLIPLQLYVFSRLPDLMATRPSERGQWVVLVLAYYATVQFVWLFFAVHSRYWLPYRLYPLAGPV